MALVWNDELELNEVAISQIQHSSHSASPQPSINTLPLPGTLYPYKHSRSQRSVKVNLLMLYLGVPVCVPLLFSRYGPNGKGE